MNFVSGYFSESFATCQVLELPFKSNEFSMVIILPAKGTNIEEVEKQVTAEHIQRWLSELHEKEVEVSLPRWVMFCATEVMNYKWNPVVGCR